MQTSEIKHLISKFPFLENHFLGVYAINEIPKKMKVKTCLVFNLDQSYKSGSHWCALIHVKKKTYEIFDSLGCKMSKIKPYLKFKNAKYRYNTGSFQSTLSHTCGLYACYYIINRMYNLYDSYTEFLSEIFCTNTIKNEKKVYKFFVNI